MLVTQTYHTKMNVVYYMKIRVSYQYMFIYQACKTKMFLCKIINTVHGSTTTCQCEALHVASLRSPESNYAFLCQHIKGHRINTLETTNRKVIQCSIHARICDSAGRTDDFITEMCILYNQQDATYTIFFIIISPLHISGGFSTRNMYSALNNKNVV